MIDFGIVLGLGLGLDSPLNCFTKYSPPNILHQIFSTKYSPPNILLHQIFFTKYFSPNFFIKFFHQIFSTKFFHQISSKIENEKKTAQRSSSLRLSRLLLCLSLVALSFVAAPCLGSLRTPRLGLRHGQHTRLYNVSQALNRTRNVTIQRLE
jgi:hypothetical protein